MSRGDSPRYDLVLENGRYITGHCLMPGEECVDGVLVVHRLRLRWWLRLPAAGAILRNMWAKSHGAQLYPPPS